jgi:hypothetical protein
VVEAVVEPEPAPAVEPEPAVVAHVLAQQEPQNDTEWWAKQLGSPLEAA